MYIISEIGTEKTTLKKVRHGHFRTVRLKKKKLKVPLAKDAREGAFRARYRRVAPRCRCRRRRPAICRRLLVPHLSGRPLAPVSALREQSLAAAAGVAGAVVVVIVVVGPLFVINHLRCTPRATASSGAVRCVLGVGPYLGRRCPPAPVALPLVVVVVRTAPSLLSLSLSGVPSSSSVVLVGESIKSVDNAHRFFCEIRAFSLLRLANVQLQVRMEFGLLN